MFLGNPGLVHWTLFLERSADRRPVVFTGGLESRTGPVSGSLMYFLDVEVFIGILGGCAQDLGDEVVEFVLQLFKPNESDTAWHGGCLALAVRICAESETH